MEQKSNPIGRMLAQVGTEFKKAAKDPDALATGLVFLGALAQGRDEDEDIGAQLGRAAAGTALFHSALKNEKARMVNEERDRASAEEQRLTTNRLKERELAGREATTQAQIDIAQADRQGRADVAEAQGRTAIEVANIGLRGDQLRAAADQAQAGAAVAAARIKATADKEPDILALQKEIQDSELKILLEGFQVSNPGALPDAKTRQQWEAYAYGKALQRAQDFAIQRRLAQAGDWDNLAKFRQKLGVSGAVTVPAPENPTVPPGGGNQNTTNSGPQSIEQLLVKAKADEDARAAQKAAANEVATAAEAEFANLNKAQMLALRPFKAQMTPAQRAAYTARMKQLEGVQDVGPIPGQASPEAVEQFKRSQER